MDLDDVGALLLGRDLEAMIDNAKEDLRHAEYQAAKAKAWLALLQAQKVPPGAAAANDTRPGESTH